MNNWSEFGRICEANKKIAHLMNMGGKDLIAEVNKITGANIQDQHHSTFVVKALSNLKAAGYQ